MSSLRQLEPVANMHADQSGNVLHFVHCWLAGDDHDSALGPFCVECVMESFIMRPNSKCNSSSCWQIVEWSAQTAPCYQHGAGNIRRRVPARGQLKDSTRLERCSGNLQSTSGLMQSSVFQEPTPTTV